MTRLRRFRGALTRPLSLLLAAAAPMGLVEVSRASDAFTLSSDDSSAAMEKAKSAVVRVHSGDQGFSLSGTGFFIDNQGTVLTSSTIIGDNSNVTVELNGAGMEAKIIGNDPRSGLAMLKVAYADNPFLALGHSTDLKTGNAVEAVGFPLSLPVTASTGVVTDFDVRFLSKFFATSHIHASAPISPGEIGGPLVDSHGAVTGMIVPSPDEGRSTYALPAEAIQKIMADFTQYGRARHGWAGVMVIQTPDLNHDGRTVRVVQAVPGTPAAKSGILPGDTVLRIDSREIYRPADVMDASFFSHVGGEMNVVVRRDAQLLTYTFAVIERPDHPTTSTSLTERSEALKSIVVSSHAGPAAQ